jgi:hypothetical protein
MITSDMTGNAKGNRKRAKRVAPFSMVPSLGLEINTKCRVKLTTDA